jgi:hypothetical protein
MKMAVRLRLDHGEPDGSGGLDPRSASETQAAVLIGDPFGLIACVDVATEVTIDS